MFNYWPISYISSNPPRFSCFYCCHCLSQDILPNDLPQLFQHDGKSENPRSKLTSTTELCAAAVVHRKIHTVEMEHKAKVNEILGPEDDVYNWMFVFWGVPPSCGRWHKKRVIDINVHRPLRMMLDDVGWCDESGLHLPLETQRCSFSKMLGCFRYHTSSIHCPHLHWDQMPFTPKIWMFGVTLPALFFSEKTPRMTDFCNGRFAEKERQIMAACSRSADIFGRMNILMC